MKGLDIRRNKSGFVAVRLHFSSDPAKDAQWVASVKPGYASWQWTAEQEIDFAARGGKRVYDMWDSAVHEVVLGTIPDMWTRYGCLDHGLANPTAHLWAAVDTKDNIWITQEYYEAERTIQANCAAILEAQTPADVPTMIWCDPSLATRDPKDKQALIDTYAECGLVMTPGNNRMGFDPVVRGLLNALAQWSIEKGMLHEYFEKMEPRADEETVAAMAEQPALRFAVTCPNTIREHKGLRWAETVGNPTEHNRKEKAQDVDDHTTDAVRYLMAAEPRHVKVQAHVPYARRSMMKRGAR